MKLFKTSGLIKRLPNAVSCIRIAGAFALPFLMWRSWETEITLPIINRTFYDVPIVWVITYLILLCTDKLDGTLARRLKAESELGATLDVLGDILILAMGATLCFAWFVRDNLEPWQFWLYLGIMGVAVFTRVFVFMLSKIYHGKGNMLHSYIQKAFTILCCIFISFWAFSRTIPEWTIYSLLAIILYGTIDESIYIVRTAEYNVNFKGHGFEKYEKRKSKEIV